MKTTIKTIALSLLVVTMSNLAIASEKSDKVVSPELEVYIRPVADTQVAVLFNKLEGEVVKVKIYDAEGELIHVDREEKGTQYGKKFDLKKYPAGEYTYKVSNGVYSVSKVVTLN